MSSYQSGLDGEEQAIAYLEERNIRVLHKRYRAADGEIDIIAKDGDVVCFIEVKFRPQGRLGEGVRAVSTDKRMRMHRAAKHYLRAEKQSAKWRYDTVEITRAGVWYLKNGAQRT